MKLNKNIVFEINKIKKEIEGKPLVEDKKKAVKELSKLIVSAVDKRVKGKVGIAFSGGVDSTLLAFVCSKLGRKFCLYSVGMQGSADLEVAPRIAMRMRWPIKIKILNIGELENVFRDVVKITGKRDIVTVGVGAVTYSALKMMKKDGIKVALTGLGSEEIFAGYERHMKGEGIIEECWKGLSDMWERDLVRDTKIGDFFRVGLKCPFLDRDLVKYSMMVDTKLKVFRGVKKHVLMETGLSLGLDKEFAFRKKKAAQYGSSFDKVISKLAKRDGFKFKKEWLDSL